MQVHWRKQLSGEFDQGIAIQKGRQEDRKCGKLRKLRHKKPTINDGEVAKNVGN